MIINILSYLEATSERFPNKIALSDDKNEITFATWKSYAESIGTGIHEKTNGSTRKAVIVFVDRRIEGLVSFMGVVESGNFYVPIDSAMPKERIKIIVDVLEPVAAITITVKDKQVLDSIGFNQFIIHYDDAIAIQPNHEILKNIRSSMIDTDPVYSIFTSGSTGVPKGVVVSHRGMIDLADWLVDTFHFTPDDNLGNQTPFYFDGSVKDICICLKTGASMHVIGKKYFSFPKTLVRLLNDRQISVILWATSAIILIGNSDILNFEAPQYIRFIAFAGEAMPAKQLKVWQRKIPNATYVNLYGPTEITVDCTYYVVDRNFNDDEFIPIGQPCRNMQILVLNEDDKLVAKGEQGELCVRGTGVSLGYYNNKEKSESVFVQNPLNPFYEDRIYRTGDIVKYNALGELVFVSRKDFQIKHKGNRIELGEIEVAVNALCIITNATCIFDKTTDRIVLFYTSVDDIECDIINSIKDKVPVYMFPEVIIKLHSMPYNLNGKIDRNQLKVIYETQKNK